MGVLCGAFSQNREDRMYLPFPDSGISFWKDDNRNVDREHGNANHGTEQKGGK